VIEHRCTFAQLGWRLPGAAFVSMHAESPVLMGANAALPGRAWLLEKEGFHAQRFGRLARMESVEREAVLRSLRAEPDMINCLVLDHDELVKGPDVVVTLAWPELCCEAEGHAACS